MTATRTPTVVLLRHGESTFNASQVFTGLLDADLTDAGAAQLAVAAGLCRAAGILPTVVLTSPMRRALRTTELFCEGLGLPPAHAAVTWRLCERDYGCLTGMAKADARETYGEDAFFTWRRTIDGRPPAASPAQIATWVNPPPVADHGPIVPGSGEALADVIERVRPLWEDVLAPHLARTGETVVVIAHGNSLRALCHLVFGLGEAETENLNIPAGHPLVFTLEGGVPAPRLGRYLDEASAHRAADAVAAEGGT